MTGPRALFGRTRELDAIVQALDLAVSGRGGLLVATGEPGIGKTSLLHQAAAVANGKGFAVAWGRGWEMGGAPMFWPWVEALRALGPATGAEGAPVLTREEIGGGGAERFVLFDDTAGFVARAARQKPVLILLDDLHAADVSSLLLTEFVARAIGSMRAVLFASHRDVEARATDATWSALMRLARMGSVLPLGRLASGDIAALVREVLGRDDPEIARMVTETSDGNPLFARELAALIAAKRGTSGRVDVPEGVRAVIRQRLALLSPAAVAMLSAAAVIGREFSETVLLDVASVDAQRLAEALDEARGADLVEDCGQGRWRFSHVLVAELLARELPSPTRHRLYRLAAEVLERRAAGNPDAFDDIAEHYFQAGPECIRAAGAAAVRAGEHAAKQLAFEGAAAWYLRALEARRATDPDDGSGCADLLLGAGEAYLRSAQMDAGADACLRAAAIARERGAGELLARAALTLGAELMTGVSDPRLVGILEEARATLPATDGALQARVTARLAGALQPARDPKVPMMLARDAIAMARRLGDGDVLLAVLHSANAALLDYGPWQEQVALNREAIALATTPQARLVALRAHLRLAFAHLALGDLDAFSQVAADHDRLAVGLRQPRYLWQGLLLRSMRLILEGRFAEADGLEAEARDLIVRARDPNGERALLLRRAMTLSARVAEGELVEAFTALAELAPGDMRADMTAWARLLLGDAELAREHVARLSDARFAAILEDPNFGAAFAVFVAMARDRARAALLYDRLARLSGQLVLTTGMGFCVQDFVDHLLFRLADVLDRPEDTDRHAADVLAQMTRLGARPFAARARADWGEIRLRRGDGERARELLAAARAEAEALGMPGLMRRIDRLVPDAKGPRVVPVSTRAASAPSGVSSDLPSDVPWDDAIRFQLEGEMWTITGCGERCHLRDSRGVQMLARLVGEPGRDLHVLDLSGAVETDAGDAGEILDAEARRAYGTRLSELRAELAEAEAWNDRERATRLAAEADALTEALASATGLGGRARRGGSQVERARVNVQRRIADALRRIEQATPRLGRTLTATVKTGTTCVYRPLDPMRG